VYVAEMLPVSGGKGQFSIPMQHDCISDVSVLSDIQKQVNTKVRDEFFFFYIFYIDAIIMQ
jgi:hypothetical protein